MAEVFPSPPILGKRRPGGYNDNSTNTSMVCNDAWGEATAMEGEENLGSGSPGGSMRHLNTSFHRAGHKRRRAVEAMEDGEGGGEEREGGRLGWEGSGMPQHRPGRHDTKAHGSALQAQPTTHPLISAEMSCASREDAETLGVDGRGTRLEFGVEGLRQSTGPGPMDGYGGKDGVKGSRKANRVGMGREHVYVSAMEPSGIEAREAVGGVGGNATHLLTRLQEKEAETARLLAEDAGLRQALGRAQEQVGSLDRDTRILKKGLAYQNAKLAKAEEEVEQLRQGNRQALEYIGRLEEANRLLCQRVMGLEGGRGGGDGGGGEGGGGLWGGGGGGGGRHVY